MPLSRIKIISAIILISFLSVVFLSFPMMMSGQDETMPAGCPFSAGAAPCPQDISAMIAHHIFSYKSFLNFTENNFSIAAFLALIFLAAVSTFYAISPPIFGNLAPAGTFYSPPASRDRKITRWLSLFENSPSL